jgi:hypothetical protein
MDARMRSRDPLQSPAWLRWTLIAIAALLLAASFACLLAINTIPALFAHGDGR